MDWGPIDPNDPNSPLWPAITIKQAIETVPYWFECYDHVTGDPADIYGITAVSNIGMVQVKVADKDGGAGARNVGKILMAAADGITGVFPLFNITGTLGTLGVDNHVGVITGPFSILDLGAPVGVDIAVASGPLKLTGTGPHYANLAVKSLVADEDPNEAEIQIAGDYRGTLTLGSVG